MSIKHEKTKILICGLWRINARNIIDEIVNLIIDYRVKMDIYFCLILLYVLKL